MTRSNANLLTRRCTVLKGRARFRGVVFSVLASAVIIWVATNLVAPSPVFAQVSAENPARIPVFFFVHLGDIWRYQESVGVTMVVPANGRALGHPSWSLDGAALAWEEREVVGGERRDRVVFERRPSPIGEGQASWVAEEASSPAVSPDGRYVMYETASARGATSLQIVDAAGRAVASIEGAQNGCWVVGSDTTAGSEAASESESTFRAEAGITPAGLAVAFDRDLDSFPENRGFYLYDPRTGRESRVSVPNAWAPQAGPIGDAFLFTRVEANAGALHVAKITNRSIEELVDVTKNEAFDYRWCYGWEGGDTPYVELVPMGGGRSDIFRVVDLGARTGPELALLASSFGWNASLPADSPFSDVELGDPYYEAAACLWIKRIVSGFADGSFRPSEPVRRAQMAKMLDGALGMPVYPGMLPASFLDLGQDTSPLYPREFVSAAYHYGLVQGFREGLFRPWAWISRAQAITLVVRAAGVYLHWVLPSPPPSWSGDTSEFSDPDHGSSVHTAEYNGLLAGLELAGCDLSAPATRGEVAQLLSNLLHVRGPLYDSDALRGPPGIAVANTGAVPYSPSTKPLGNVVFDGDSLTAGSTASDPYPSQLMRGFHSVVRWVNLGIGGQRLQDMLARASWQVDPLYRPDLGQNAVVVWGGTNDMRHWAHPPAVVYSQLREYCLGRRAAGYTVLVLTMLPRSDGAFPSSLEADRQTLNRLIRATWPGFADALVDVGADPLVGMGHSELDTRLFNSDRVHLNNTGLSVIAGRVGQVLTELDTNGY
jgi:lysophospholipase L1-like esterase